MRGLTYVGGKKGSAQLCVLSSILRFQEQHISGCNKVLSCHLPIFWQDDSGTTYFKSKKCRQWNISQNGIQKFERWWAENLHFGTRWNIYVKSTLTYYGGILFGKGTNNPNTVLSFMIITIAPVIRGFMLTEDMWSTHVIRRAHLVSWIIRGRYDNIIPLTHSNASRNIVKGESHYFNQNQPITCINAYMVTLKLSLYRYALKWFDVREEIVRNLIWKWCFKLLLKGGSFWNMWPKVVDVMNCY